LGTTNSSFVFRFFDALGQPIGPKFSPIPAQGTNSPVAPLSLFDGNSFFCVLTFATLVSGEFTSGDVYGAFIPSSTAPPRLDVAGPLVAAQFPLLLTGTPGINYAIQTLTNLSLTNWTALVTNSPTTGTFNFTDTNATNASRFYRAVKQ
jgi:hypothetical protein